VNLDVLPVIVEKLQSCCVIGAYALAARGYVRQTTDFDLMTTDRRALDDSTWKDFQDRGFRVDVRRGDADDPLAGVVRIVGSDTSIDIVVARYKWQQQVIDRSQPMKIGVSTLMIPTAADIILLKLFAGGHADVYDIYRILEIGPRADLIDNIDAAVRSLPDDIRQRWDDVRRTL